MKKAKVGAVVGLLAACVIGVTALVTPVAAQGCEPVICPAIAKLCPSGEIACRPSPCNCAQVCVPEGKGCNQ